MPQNLKSAAAAVSDFVRTDRAIFDAGPELPKFKLPETKLDPVETILNMDEETFRKLFNMEKVVLPRNQEINDMDWDVIVYRKSYMPRDTQEHAETIVGQLVYEQVARVSQVYLLMLLGNIVFKWVNRMYSALGQCTKTGSERCRVESVQVS